MWRLALAVHALPPLCLLALLSGRLQRCAGQLSSVPVTNTSQFADALNNQAISEIILDPFGTGVSGSCCWGVMCRHCTCRTSSPS
jgi:hypothetical protein